LQKHWGFLLQMKTPLIEIEHLHYAYAEQPVLEDIHLTVEEGEFLGIVGPNGSGKSTLVRCLLGFLKKRQGRIRVRGEEVSKLQDRLNVGYVSQKANSFHSMFPATVKEVVQSGLYGKLGLFRRLKKEHIEKVENAIDLVGLTSVQNRSIGKLSGGQQQRAFIARALVAEPELLVLDEPTVGVDEKTTGQFYDLLNRLHREEGLTLLMVNHDLQAVSGLADQVACLNRRLIFHGDPGEFQQRQQEILSKAYQYEQMGV
jgi:zinc transport system ATP-binding protein